MKYKTIISKVVLITQILVVILVAKNIYANNLGVMGETYPIAEIDFLDFIQSRVESMQKNGHWQALQDRIKQDAIRYRDRPKKVEGLTRATETKTRIFDPSIILDHDVTTYDGRVIAKANTRVNPLNYITLSKTLIFYNGDDPEQVNWVSQLDRKLKGRDKLILVNGSTLEQEKHFKKPIYFDQAGFLTSRFSIRHVPAQVSQDKFVLLIKEVKL